MKRLIYCSEVTTEISPDDVITLLEVSRSNNESVGLTGMLLFTSHSFLQLLEGEAAVVRRTFDRIVADKRHTNLRLLLNSDVDQPLFPTWTMGFEHVDDDELAEHLDGFTPAPTYPPLHPDLITSGGVAQTLLELYAKNGAR